MSPPGLPDRYSGISLTKIQAMKDFVFIFRNSLYEGEKQSPEELQAITTSWMNWMGSIAAQNKLSNPGNRLAYADARTVKPGNVVTDGPYTEIKEFINGFIVVKTETIEEAVELAKGCPIFSAGGNVEVRTTIPM